MKRIGITLLVFKALVLAGCAGGNAIDRAVPQAAFAESGVPLPPPARPDDENAAVLQDVEARAQQELTPDPVFESSGQASTAAGYPNINLEPHGATAQLTDAERDTLLVQMQALGQAHAQGKVSSADYDRRLAQLRLLAKTHSNETIMTIEE
jgi:hypothetical protein